MSRVEPNMVKWCAPSRHTCGRIGFKVTVFDKITSALSITSECKKYQPTGACVKFEGFHQVRAAHSVVKPLRLWTCGGLLVVLRRVVAILIGSRGIY